MGELINFDFDDMNEKLDRIEAKLNEINELLSGVMKEIEGEEMDKSNESRNDITQLINHKNTTTTSYDVNIKYNNE
jgi:phage head maturation protease